jgi:hypothetical protein
MGVDDIHSLDRDDGTISFKDTVSELDRIDCETKLVEVKEVLAVPYPEFCRQPSICAGKGSCPLDPYCAD